MDDTQKEDVKPKTKIEIMVTYQEKCKAVLFRMDGRFSVSTNSYQICSKANVFAAESLGCLRSESVPRMSTRFRGLRPAIAESAKDG